MEIFRFFFSNVPARLLSDAELVDIDKKVQEIERGVRTEDIDEDDAGKGINISVFHSFPSISQASNVHQNCRISMMVIVIPNLVVQIEMIFVLMPNTILPSTPFPLFLSNSHLFLFHRRENWRTAGNANRRGANPKQNQYNSTHNRQQYNPRNNPRNNRYAENQAAYETRDLTLQTTNEEPTRNQRLNSGSFSQGQSSGPTSPSGIVAGRTIYSNTHRSSVNRNSPTPHAGSSSSRKNSMSNTTSPPNQQVGTNKVNRKPSNRKNELC